MEAKVGILAFQGDIEEHQAAFVRLGHSAERVLTAKQLEGMTHLVIPGGESTVMSKFLKPSPLKQAIIDRIRLGQLSIFGTCAGAILLAKTVHPSKDVENMGLIDIEVERNAYGSQLHSFEAEVTFLPKKQQITATFIRAPQFTKIGEGVEVLAEYEGVPILIRQGNIMAATFHPEYLLEPQVHQYFLEW